jgi:hypothetical protein
MSDGGWYCGLPQDVLLDSKPDEPDLDFDDLLCPTEVVDAPAPPDAACEGDQSHRGAPLERATHMRTRACKQAHSLTRVHGRTRACTHTGAQAWVRRLLLSAPPTPAAPSSAPSAPPTGTPTAMLTTEPTAAPTGDHRHLRRGSRILVNWMANSSAAPSLSHETSRRALRRILRLTHTSDTTTPADSSEPQTVALDLLHPLHSGSTPFVLPSPWPALRPREETEESPSDAHASFESELSISMPAAEEHSADLAFV